MFVVLYEIMDYETSITNYYTLGFFDDKQLAENAIDVHVQDYKEKSKKRNNAMHEYLKQSKLFSNDKQKLKELSDNYLSLSIKSTSHFNTRNLFKIVEVKINTLYPNGVVDYDI